MSLDFQNQNDYLRDKIPTSHIDFIDSIYSMTLKNPTSFPKASFIEIKKADCDKKMAQKVINKNAQDLPDMTDLSNIDTKGCYIAKNGKEIEDLPKNGIYELYIFYKLSLKMTYKNGKKNGLTWVYNNEKLMKTITYKDDILEGEGILYYEDGKSIQQTLTFKKGKITGPTVFYTPEGVKQQEGALVDGQFHGDVYFYNQFGDVIQKRHYDHGALDKESICYYGQEHGGGISMVEQYDKGQKLCENMFYDTGELMQATPYKGGRPAAYPMRYEKSGKPIAANRN